MKALDILAAVFLAVLVIAPIVYFAGKPAACQCDPCACVSPCECK